MSVQDFALRSADTVAQRLGLLGKRLSADDLIESAARRSRSAPFADIAVAEPLQRLLDACVTEAEMSLCGLLALRWGSRRYLATLARFRREERKAPELLREPIEAPVFITGLPRSGTTFLQRLLLHDPANQAPRVWQTEYPYPIDAAGHRPDGRRKRMARQLRAFQRLTPELSALQPLHSDSPQECSEITAQVFRSLRYDTTYRIPGYRSWLDEDGHEEAYRFLKRFLQHLRYQGEDGRWVLKCPDHVFALTEIRTVFPDAKLVFVHRDPVRVLLSVTKLTEAVRRPFTRHIDRLEIGRQESMRWHQGTRHMMRAESNPGPFPLISHVHYLDLIADPVGTIRELYRNLNLPWVPETGAKISDAVRSQPRGGYGPRSYQADEYGLDPKAEYDRFRDYLRYFGVSPESRQDRSN